MILLLALFRSLFASADPTRIEWQRDTLRLIQENGFYGRIVREASGTLLCCFEWRGQIWIKPSEDEGCSWRDAIQVSHYEHGNAANPELLQLLNGTILCFYNERPGDGIHPFQIAFCASQDGGQSWSHREVLYTADTVGENGCREPAAIQLPEGEIQVFFANENPYRSSAEQEITLIRGDPDAKSWKEPQRISFRPGYRDGMPVPVILQDGKGIAVAIEDNGLCGAFKPVILHTSRSVNWNQPFIDGDSVHRWSALKSAPAADIYAGAPYLRQMPSGETLLSFQIQDENRSQRQMTVYVGDSEARNFDGGSFPFDLPGDVPCQWGSLFVKDERTVTVLATTCIAGVPGLWSIDGTLVKTPKERFEQDSEE
jgi:hypothetical protein